MRARDIEGLDSTVSTEEMLRNAGIERVANEVIFAPQQSKGIPGHQQMQKTRTAANTAIAVVGADSRRRIDFESNPTAVAAPFVSRH
jgi:hypothetical protein